MAAPTLLYQLLVHFDLKKKKIVRAVVLAVTAIRAAPVTYAYWYVAV